MPPCIAPLEFLTEDRATLGSDLSAGRTVTPMRQDNLLLVFHGGEQVCFSVAGIGINPGINPE